MCCTLKPLCAWNLERTASVCRERCGGAGYLSCSRFGSLIGFSHAGITAEGDNRVLFQKAAKELLASIDTNKVKTRLHLARAYSPLNPSSISGCNIGDIRNLFIARESKLMISLQKAMKGASYSSSDVFDAWMHRESDNVQALTQAYGEREVLEAGMRAVEEASPKLHTLLLPVIQVNYLQQYTNIQLL